MHFLGFDVSTQSISAVIIDFEGRKISHYISLPYDEYLPHYKTQGGVIRRNDPKVVHSYPLMWAEALDLILDRLVKEKISLGAIKAVSGSAQQHGSVYLSKNAITILPNLNPDKELKIQLKDIFSRETSPVWMDSSTQEECIEITKAIGGGEAMSRISGSVAFERFTGPQIRKFYKKERGKYEHTASINLVSSFMASLLSGKIAPIDYGDGSGMNLMDIKRKRWNKKLAQATAPALLSKLPPLSHPAAIIGTIHNYFVRRYGFSPDTLLNVWSGDNPNSLIGMGVSEPGEAVVSLGTSDTFFLLTKNINVDTNGEGHVFVAPTGDYMNLICFKNGSLARERIRRMFGLSWPDFSRLLRDTPVGNKGRIVLPWFEPEIVPPVFSPGLRRFMLDGGDVPGHVRAVVEAQAMAMKLHSAWMNMTPRCIYVTGGASENREILKIIADVFDTPVYSLSVTKSAALGAALRAAHSYFKKKGKGLRWHGLTTKFVCYDTSRAIKPDRDNVGIYKELIRFYKACEDHAVSLEER